MELKYKHYEYMGAKIGVPLYYCMEENQFYLHHAPGVSYKISAAITMSLAPFLSVIMRKWNAPGLYYNEKVYVAVCAILGVGIGLFLYVYVRRTRARYFSEIQPSEPLPRETLKELVRYEIGVNWRCRFLRILCPMMIIGVPIMLRGGRNLFLFITYPVAWYFEIVVLVNYNLRNRKKMIRNIKKTYIKNQDNQKSA